MNIAIIFLSIAVIACSLSVIAFGIRLNQLKGKVRINEMDMSHLRAGIMKLHSIIQDHKEKDHKKSSPNSEQRQINEIRSCILGAMKKTASFAETAGVQAEELERFNLLMTALERFDEITGEKQHKPPRPLPSWLKTTPRKEDTN